MAPKKRAVVYILDASPSMKSSFALKKQTASAAATSTATCTNTKSSSSTTTTTTSTTRFDSAKRALQTMVGNLMMSSTANECCIMLLKTRGTRHHLIASTQDVEAAAAAAAEIALAADDENDNHVAGTTFADVLVPFAHITELTPSIIKPSCSMMQRIQNEMKIDYETQDEADFLLLPGSGRVSGSGNAEGGSGGGGDDGDDGGGGGDLCHGIILAMDALYKKTKRFSVQRSIVLITDGVHQGRVDFQQLLYTIDVLREMDCPIHVIGLDFPSTLSSSSSPTTTTSLTSCTPAPPPPVSYKNDQVHQCLYKGPEQWQAFLETLLDKTGGQLHIVHDEVTLQEVIDNCKYKKKEATGFKCNLILAPNLTLKVKTFGIWQRTGCHPSIKQNRAFQLKDRYNNSNNNSHSQSALSQLDASSSSSLLKVNAIGEHMLDDVKPKKFFVNLDKDPGLLYEFDETTKAVNYADKWIALDALQLGGLRYQDTFEEKTLQVLGYLKRSTQVPMTLVMGPPVLVAGGESKKSTVAIAALARALFHLDLVAIAMYTKSKNGKPVLGGLFPKLDQMQKYPHDEDKNGKGGLLHLLFLGLPFASDVKKGLPRSDWQDEVEELMEAYQQEQQQKQQQPADNMAILCDNLIDSLMLSSPDIDDVMDMYNNPVPISNPLAASWQQTIIQRILDPNAPIVDSRCGTTSTTRSSRSRSIATDAVAMDIDDSGNKNSNHEDVMQDPMGTPPDILKQAHASMSAFYKAFPAPKPDPKNVDKKTKSSS